MADTTELTFVEQFVHITAPPIPYLIVAGRSVYRAGDAHEKRTLPDTFDIILVHSGTLHITVGTDQVSVKPKGFLILPPGMRHGGPCERATIFSWMHFHCDGPVEYNNRPARQQVVRGNKNLYYRKNEFPVTLPVYGQLDDATYELVQSDFKEIEQALIDRYQRTKRFRQLRKCIPPANPCSCASSPPSAKSASTADPKATTTCRRGSNAICTTITRWRSPCGRSPGSSSATRGISHAS